MKKIIFLMGVEMGAEALSARNTPVATTPAPAAIRSCRKLRRAIPAEGGLVIPFHYSPFRDEHLHFDSHACIRIRRPPSTPSSFLRLLLHAENILAFFGNELFHFTRRIPGIIEWEELGLVLNEPSIFRSPGNGSVCGFVVCNTYW